MSHVPPHVDRHIKEVVGSYFQNHYEIESQRAALRELRASEGIVALDDATLERYAALPEGAFRRKCEEVRTHYARDRRYAGRRAAGAGLTAGETRAVTALATRKGLTFPEALKEYRAARAAG